MSVGISFFPTANVLFYKEMPFLCPVSLLANSLGGPYEKRNN